MSEQPTANQIVRQIADRIALKACGTAWRDTESQARAAASYAAHEIFDLERELAEARADAERFVWYVTRQDGSDLITRMLIDEIGGEMHTLDEWRAAVDAARAADNGGKADE